MNKKAWIDKEFSIQKLYGAYTQMKNAGADERAKGVYRAIKLLRDVPTYYSKEAKK